MGLVRWFSTNWFEFLQSLGIIGGLFLSAHAARRDEQARRITNLNAIKQDYIQIWNKVIERPELGRVLERSADLREHPITAAERAFVKELIVHLDTVHRTMRIGMFVELEGLRKDVGGFFKSPIAMSIWQEFREVQDKEFVRFVEAAMR
jgi:hypothetical protein